METALRIFAACLKVKSRQMSKWTPVLQKSTFKLAMKYHRQYSFIKKIIGLISERGSSMTAEATRLGKKTVKSKAMALCRKAKYVPFRQVQILEKNACEVVMERMEKTDRPKAALTIEELCNDLKSCRPTPKVSLQPASDTWKKVDRSCSWTSTASLECYNELKNTFDKKRCNYVYDEVKTAFVNKDASSNLRSFAYDERTDTFKKTLCAVNKKKPTTRSLTLVLVNGLCKEGADLFIIPSEDEQHPKSVWEKNVCLNPNCDEITCPLHLLAKMQKYKEMKKLGNIDKPDDLDENCAEEIIEGQQCATMNKDGPLLPAVQVEHMPSTNSLEVPTAEAQKTLPFAPSHKKENNKIRCFFKFPFYCDDSCLDLHSMCKIKDTKTFPKYLRCLPCSSELSVSDNCIFVKRPTCKCTSLANTKKTYVKSLSGKQIAYRRLGINGSESKLRKLIKGIKVVAKNIYVRSFRKKDDE